MKFNVGLGDGNVTKIELAKIIKKHVKGLKLLIIKKEKILIKETILSVARN